MSSATCHFRLLATELMVDLEAVAEETTEAVELLFMEQLFKLSVLNMALSVVSCALK